eukprot:COSAG01_NODE_144_length_24108_cov_11.490441_24_plen_89_part_00
MFARRAARVVRHFQTPLKWGNLDDAAAVRKMSPGGRGFDVVLAAGILYADPDADDTCSAMLDGLPVSAGHARPAAKQGWVPVGGGWCR